MISPSLRPPQRSFHAAALIKILPSRIDLEAERCARSLSYYIRRAWPIVEPATAYIHNWHIGLISEYLTALTRLEIQNLIINIPPRHMKSLLTVVMWPTWVWINMPASATSPQSTRNSC